MVLTYTRRNFVRNQERRQHTNRKLIPPKLGRLNYCKISKENILRKVNLNKDIILKEGYIEIPKLIQEDALGTFENALNAEAAITIYMEKLRLTT